jgi:hypothetical protein
MLTANVVEHLLGRSCAATGYVIKPLADSFVYVGASGDVEQPLIGSGILDDRFGLALHGENHRPPALLELFHEIPERRRKVVSDWMSLVISSMWAAWKY